MGATMYSGVHAWIILGNADKRKGSLIRALTGLDSPKDCDVSLTSGQMMRLWTQISSLNESEGGKKEKSQDFETAKDFAKSTIDEVGANLKPPVSRRNILVALQLGYPVKSFRAEDYVRQFVAHGFFIEGVVTLGERTPEWVKALGAPYSEVCDVLVPTNEIALHVKRHWGWL